VGVPSPLHQRHAPNIRDFRGFSSKSFDGRGNYACGISDNPSSRKSKSTRSSAPSAFDLIFVTSAPTDAKAAPSSRAGHAVPRHEEGQRSSEAVAAN
jgi:large subunit ribosomal protein L5